MDIEIITIGDEVLRSEISGDNASWISRMLTSSGIEPSRVTVLPDRLDVIAAELRAAAGRSRLVVVTGGLGPTVDDLTRQAAIEAFGGEDELREGIFDSIKARFDSIGIDVPAGYMDLARVPRGAESLHNDVGAAPGLMINAGDCKVFLLPGVPAEMKPMFERYVMPALIHSGVRRVAVGVFGMMETTAEDLLRGVIGDERLRGVSVISGPCGVRMYMPESLVMSETGRSIRDVFGHHLFSLNGSTLEESVHRLMLDSGKTLATAESFTGGALASALVSLPGASEYFMEGFVTYSNEAKTRSLGVDPAILGRHGAVSSETAEAMAEGARKMAGTDLALSTTGIAGPGGGSREKPAGLFYLGLAAADGTFSRRFRFRGDRTMVRTRGVCSALDMLRLWLSGHVKRLSD